MIPAKGAVVGGGGGGGGGLNITLQNLDLARSNGKWNEVQELANKGIKILGGNGNGNGGVAQVALIEAQLIGLLRSRSRYQDELLVPPEEGSGLKEKVKEIGVGLSGLNGEESKEYQFIHNVLIAHIQLIEGRFSEVIKTLGSFPIPNSSALTYTKAASFKAKCILGTAFEYTGDINNAILTYKDPLVVPTTPEGIAWCEVLYYKFVSLITSEPACQVIKTNPNLSSLTLYALRQYCSISGRSYEPVGRSNEKLSYHKLFLEHASNELSKDVKNVQLQNEVREISNNYEKTLFTTNNYSNLETENYLRILIKNWRSVTELTYPRGVVIDEGGINYTKHVFEILKKAAYSTFHSSRVMRYHIEILIALGEYDEALSAFNTYEAYEEKHRVMRNREGGSGGDSSSSNSSSSNQPQGDSIKGICDAYYKIIRVIIHIKRDRPRAKDLADKLSQWIVIPNINKEVEGTSGQTQQPHLPADVLAKSYGAIGEAYAYFSKATFPDEEHYNSILKTALYNYELSLESSNKNTNISYNYALLLAQTSNINKAIEIVKTGLTYDQDHFPSWHLLALLFTAQENYDIANKLLNSSIEKALQENQKGNLKGIETKGCIIQMKLTQLSIIEITTNVESVLEYLPEALSLYGRLFPNDIETNGNATKLLNDTNEKVLNGNGNGNRKNATNNTSNNTINNDTPTSTTPKSRRTIGLKQSITRIRSKSTTPNGHHHAASDVENEKLIKPTSPLQQRLYHDIWLYMAGVYRRSNMTRDAEECIVEAEHMYRESADTQVELGQLMANDRPLHALKQYESALDENGDHLKATLSLAQLILTHSTLGNPTTSSTALPKPFEFFISRKDELAAHARLQSLLETQVAKYPGRYSSEAWYFLGCLYEKSNQQKNAEKSLWKSITLEEDNSIRDFSLSRYYY